MQIWEECSSVTAQSSCYDSLCSLTLPANKKEVIIFKFWQSTLCQADWTVPSGKRYYKLWFFVSRLNLLYFSPCILIVVFFVVLQRVWHDKQLSMHVRMLVSVIKISICERINGFQFSSVAQSRPTLCNPMNHSTPGLPVHHQLPELTQIHSIESVMPSSHLIPCSPLLPPAPKSSQHQGLFQWVNSLHEVAKVLEFQLQHQSFQWTPTPS